MVNSESVFKAIDHTVSDLHIPWSNLVQLRIKAKAPNIIDVDGYICHTIHNAAKMFAKQFDSCIDRLFIDIHLDVYCLTDLSELMKEICELCILIYKR